MKLRSLKCSRGSVLLVVLWMIILIGFVGLAYSFSVRSQVQVTSNARGKAEAYWSARAGIEKARAMLMGMDPAIPLTDADLLFNDEEYLANQELPTGRFTVAAPRVFPDDEMRFGLTDVASCVNINNASREMLMLLPAMTDEMADCLIDWRDEDEFPQPLGAENDYYMFLEDPYPARNGNLVSVAELMRVRAWAPVFRGAKPDPYDAFLPPEAQPERADPELSRRLMASITAWSVDRGLAPDGDAKIALSEADDTAIRRRVRGLSRDEAEAIEDYREDNRFDAVTDLLDVTAVEETTNDRRGQNNNSNNPRNNRRDSPTPATQTQRRVFNLQRVGEIIDYFTIDENQDEVKPGLVNINTASFDVLMAIPGMTEEIAMAIQNARAEAPIETAGSIASMPGMTDALFRQIYPAIMTTSNRFHVVSHGTDIEGRARATIEAVLSVEDDGVEIVYWREE